MATYMVRASFSTVGLLSLTTRDELLLRQRGSTSFTLIMSERCEVHVKDALYFVDNLFTNDQRLLLPPA